MKKPKEKTDKGCLFLSVALIVVAGILSARNFLDGRTTDAVLWLIAVALTLLKEIRRYIRNRQDISV